MSVTPMDLSNFTVPELRAQLRERCERGFDNGIEPNADGTYGLPKPISKMRKAELIDAIVKAAKAQEKQEAEEHAAEQGLVGEFGDLAASANRTAEALNTAGLAAQEAARKLMAVAWAHQVAVVHSMGRTVRGKVVDMVLREPGANGMGRVLLVVEHEAGEDRRLRPNPEHPRRTLHALADVKFEPLAS